MGTFTERIATVETPVVNDNGPAIPTIWWNNGSKQARTPGMFYIKGDTLEHEPGEPWTPSERFENEAGFSVTTLHLALITWRQQPYLTNEVISGGEKRKERRYITEWEPGAQIHTEIVCLAEGIPEPVVWSFHGMTGRAVMSKSGMFSTYRAGLLHVAEQAAGKRLPLWTFWLPVTTLCDEKGKTVYTDTGHGSFVTLPTFAWSNESEAARMDTLFIGEEWVTYGYEVRTQFEHWRTQRRGTAQTRVVQAKANGNGHARFEEEPPLEVEDDLL